MFLLEPAVFGWDFLIALLLTFGFAAFVWSIATLRRSAGKNVAQKFLVGLIGFFGLIGGSTVIYGAFIEPQLIIVDRFTATLPTKQPLRIAVVGDLHVGPYKGSAFVRRVVSRVNEQLPDLVLLPGDFIHTAGADVSDLAPLGNIRASLGVYAIMGNHDLGMYRRLDAHTGDFVRESRGDDLERFLTSLSIRVLRNENHVLPTQKGRIAIAGVDDIWAESSDIDATFTDIPHDIPIILLAHNPDISRKSASRRADLIVTAHTHGGQVRLPFWGPVAEIPTTLGQHFDQGLFTVDDDTTLAITRGVGESGPRVRLFAWPEVMVIETTPSR